MALGFAAGQDAACGCFPWVAVMHSWKTPAPVQHWPLGLGWVLQPLWSLQLDSSQSESHREAGMRRQVMNCLEGHEQSFRHLSFPITTDSTWKCSAGPWEGEEVPSAF